MGLGLGFGRDRVVAACSEDEERLHRAQQHAEAAQSIGGAR